MSKKEIRTVITWSELEEWDPDEFFEADDPKTRKILINGYVRPAILSLTIAEDDGHILVNIAGYDGRTKAYIDDDGSYVCEARLGASDAGELYLSSDGVLGIGVGETFKFENYTVRSEIVKDKTSSTVAVYVSCGQEEKQLLTLSYSKFTDTPFVKVRVPYLDGPYTSSSQPCYLLYGFTYYWGVGK